jgi:hypothetical protein
MNEHTPAPWKLGEGEYGDLTLVGIPFVDHPDNWPDADLMDGSEGEYLWFDVSDQPDLGQHAHGEANARLIHAAPDMLAVLTDKLLCTVSNATFADDLETIARAVDLSGFNITAADLLEKAKQIRTAVAKATMRAAEGE